MTETTARYRQRPIEVEAIQWTGSNAEELTAFTERRFFTIDPEDRAEDPDCDAQLLVEASHWVGIRPGDWVLKFEGYFMAKSDVPFRAVWEPAAETQAVDVEALARLLNGADVHIHNGHHPDWDSLAESGEEQYLGMARWLLKRLHVAQREPAAPAAVPSAPAVLSDTERQFLTYALDLAADQMASRGNEFEDEDRAALEKLRRMAGEAPANIQCPDAFWTKQPHAPHDWQQRPDAPPVHCPGMNGEAAGPGRVAGEAQQPETQDATHEWFVETRMLDGRWSKYGAARDTAEDGRELFERDTASLTKPHAFRLVHATTTFAIEAEHEPAAVSQPGKEATQ
jgi:hypothetical protein